MATPFRLKRSAVADRRPTTTDLQLGELALNTHDGFLYAETTGVGSTVSLLTPWREQYGSPTSIYYNHRVGIGSTNPTVSLDVVGDTKLQNNLSVTGLSTFSEGIFIPDDKKIEIGNAAGNGDLQLYYDSTPGESFISHTGPGVFKIEGNGGNNIFIRPRSGENSITAKIDAEVELFYNGNLRFETTNTGVDITDTLKVAGVSTFTDTVNINGVIEANSNVNVDGNLDVDGRTELDITNISETLNVSGISTFAGITTVTGETLFTKQLNVSGIVTATSNIEIGSFIKHLGDTNTMIGFPSDDNIQFKTHNTERLRIISNGKIGIGTDNPTELVDIQSDNSEQLRLYTKASTSNATLNIRGGNNGNSIIEFGDTADDDIGKIRYRHNSDSNSMEFITNTEERLRITGDGKVGINVTDPDSIFNVRPLDESNFLIRNEGSIIVLASETNSGRDNNRGMDFEASAYRFIEGGSEKVRIDSSGKVGINSTSPTHELEVLGDSSLKGNVNVTGVSTFSGNINANGNIVGDNSTAITGIANVTGQNANSLKLLNVRYIGNTTTVFNTSFLHFSDQNVPAFGSGGNFSTLASVSGLNLIFDSNNNDNNGLVIGSGSTNTSLMTTHMVVSHQGNVGINSTAPTHKLEVLGDTSLKGNLTVSGISTFANNVKVLDGVLTIESVTPELIFNDTTGSPDYKIRKQSGHFMIMETGQTNDSEWRLSIRSGGTIDIPGNLDTHGNLDVDGHTELDNLNVSGVSTFTGISTFNNSVGLAHTIFYLDDPDNKLEFSGSDSFSVYIGGFIRFLVRTNSVTVGEDLVISDKLTHNNDTNTMMRFPEDNTITFENNNVGETLRIAGTGNIGIGTTNPTAKLDVNGDTKLQGNLHITGVSTFVSDLSVAENIVHTGDTNTKISFPSVGDNITFTTGGSTAVTFDENQRVGIGTADPTQRLDVVGSGIMFRAPSTNVALYLKSRGSIHSSDIYFGRDAGQKGSLRYHHDDDSMRFCVNGAFTERLRITNVGNVGIGSTIPTSKLDVDGDAKISGIVTATTFVGNLTGTASTVSTVAVSDESTSETCFPLFVTASVSGGLIQAANLAPKAGSNLSFNSAFGILQTSKLSSVFATISSGIEQTSASGISTFSGSLDVDGQTDLDDLAVSGVSTFTNTVHSASVLASFLQSSGNIIAIGNLQTSSGGVIAAYGNISGNAGIGSLVVSGISTFNDNTIIDGSLTVGSNHSSITGGAPTDQGNLAVYGTGKNSLIIQTTSNADDRGIAWRNSGDAYVAYISAVNRGNSYADLRFGVHDTNNSNVDLVSERMRITKEGNVGIGTVTPNSLLHLHQSSTSGFYGLRLTNSTTGVSSTSGFSIELDDNETTRIWNYGNESISFGVDNELHGTLRQDGRWCLGLNQTSGSTVLNVFSTNGPSARFLSDNDAGISIYDDSDNSDVEIRNNNGQLTIDLDHSNQVTTEAFIIKVNGTSANEKEFFRINSDGDVGIGTNNPTRKLEVLGDSSLNGNLIVSGISTFTTPLTNSNLANSTVSFGGISLALGASDATPAFDLTDATNYPTSSLSGTITNAQLAGSIANDKLANSAITVSDGSNSTATSLGGTITFSGTNNEVDVAESSGTVTIGLPNNVTIGNNLTVTGNLQVDGSTTTINTATLSVEDKNIEIAKGATNDAAADGAGITVDAGSDTDKTWNWVDATDSWTSSEHINLASGKRYKINGTGVLSANALGAGIVNSALTGVGTITSGTWNGTAIVNANLANSTVSYGGVSLSLGGSDATPAFDLTDATGYPTSSLVGTITNAQLANSTVSFGGISLALGASDATPAFNLTDATGYPTSSLVGTITNAQLAGSIANAKLANSTVSFGGISLALGASDATPAFDLTDATNYPTSSLSGTITNAQLAGLIANDKLANSTVSFGGISLSLGGSDNTPAFDLADATGLPISTGVSGLAANVSTFLGTPSSANLRSALTDETGTGNAVFSASPTLTGTVSAANLSVSGDLSVAENIVHTGNTNTKIVFTENQIDLQTGGFSRIYATNFAVYVRSGLPLAFLSSTGPTPNMKSGGTNNQDLLFTTGTGNPTRLHIKSDGNVGIGTDNPTNKLEVLGDTLLKDNLTVSGFSTFSSLVRANNGLIVTNNVDLTGELNFTGSAAKFIDFETLADSHRFELRHHNPTGNLFETAIRSHANGSVDLFNSGTKRLETTDTGVSITDNLNVSGITTLADDKLTIENNGGQVQFSANIYSFNGESSGTAFRASSGNNIGFEAYYNSLKRFTTDSKGISVHNNLSGIGVTIEYNGQANFAGIVTAKSININGQTELDDLNVSGITTLTGQVGFGTHITLPDHARLKIGDSGDLQLYHNALNSWIVDQGTGNLVIGTNGEKIRISKGTGTESLAEFRNDSSVDLYYDNTQRFSTSGIGATVFGQLDTTDLDVDGRSELDIVNIAETLNVSGVSTFAGAIIAADSDLRFTTSSTWSGNHTKIQHFANIVYFVIGGNGAVFREGAVNRIWIDGNGNLRPNLDSDGSTGYDLGRSDFYWRSLYVNDISAKGDLDVDGQTELDDLNVSGVSTFTGNCSFAGNNVTMTASGSPNSLNVAGTSRFEIASIENAEVDGSISHTGDATTQIQFETSTIKLDTAGTTRLNINNSGVVVTGISTLSGLVRANSGLIVTGNIDLTNELNFTGNANKFVDFETLDNNKRFDFRHINASTSETAISCFGGGAVKLFNAGTKRLETTNTGVSITDNLKVAGISTFTGNIDANGDLDVDGQTELDNTNIVGIVTVTNSASGIGIKLIDFSNKQFYAGGGGGGSPFVGSYTGHDLRIVVGGFQNAIFKYGSGATGNFELGPSSGIGITFNGATGNAVYAGIITASSFSGGLPITNGADNRVITATSASAIQGEAGLRFDGSTLINAGSGFKEIAVSCSTNNSATLRLQNNQKNFAISNVTGGKIAISDGSTQRFVIDGSGNVGLGTNNLTPTSLLTLAQSSNPTLEFKDFTNNAQSLITGSAGGQLVFTTDVGNVNDNSDFVFRADSATNEIVRFKDTGEVGIGTDSPQAPLHIEDGSPGIRLSDSGNAGAFAYFDANAANVNIHADKGNNIADSRVSFAVDNSEKVRITSGGSLFVGVTTTSNNEKFVVDGDVKVSGITTSTGVINSQTDIRINNVSVIETALNDAVAMAIALG